MGNFRIGSWWVHRDHGVGQVVSIDPLTLEYANGGSPVRCRVLDRSLIREPMGVAEFRALMECIGDPIPDAPQGLTWKPVGPLFLPPVYSGCIRGECPVIDALHLPNPYPS